MQNTIVALYDTRTDAEAAVRDLEADGFDRSVTEIITHADAGAGIGSASSTGFTDTDHARHAGGGFLSRLSGWNVPDRDAHVYAEGVRRGGALLKLRVDDDDVQRAVAVLERGRVVDVDERETHYRSAGWSGYDESATAYDEDSAAEERARYAAGGLYAGGSATGMGAGAMGAGMGSAGLGGAAESFRDVNAADTTRTTTHETARDSSYTDSAFTDATARRGMGSDREEVIPVAEERIDIGKREVERGVVRVRSYVTETPVSEQVHLRQEHVHVERRSVDPASEPVSEDAFRERTVEVSETAEEAVVQKRARVTEEVVIRKDVDERAHTVSDTVRRTEVEIDDGRKDTAHSDLNRTDIDRVDTDRTLRRDDDLQR